MKTMSCKQLGGACDLEFHADSFEDMAKQSQAHGKAMFEQNETLHMEAMMAMSQLMKAPGGMAQWMAERRQEFDALPNN